MLEELSNIVYEFVRDLLHTFPEYEEKLHESLYVIYHNGSLKTISQELNPEHYEAVQKATQELMEYFNHVYPERFFDILYENGDIFTQTEVNTEFLPGIDFRVIWNDNISDRTRQTLWKYLQLILFNILSNISNKDTFKETADMFNAINEDELKQKIEDTITNMRELFETQTQQSEQDGNDGNNENNVENNGETNTNMNFPQPEDIHKHISSMMEGKLGTLAKEIAEETARDLNLDPENLHSMNDVFKTLMKNPSKLMNMVKTVSTKLDQKLKSGDVKESELLAEATDMMKRMKSMPGMDNIHKMIGKMSTGMAGNGGKGGVHMNAISAQLQQSMRIAQQRERMKSKSSQNQPQTQQQQNIVVSVEDEERANQMMEQLLREEEMEVEKVVFKRGSGAERSKKSQKPSQEQSQKSSKSKHKKNKKQVSVHGNDLREANQH
jgi:hypothetical protein